ncbi:MAG: insulinase family protein [Bacteroidales bacterium]|nr:insulinase family protein [Bacteroidales bacterium]MCF6342956.1 insulinase family protein [Bacteroidales bacterium]
MKKSTYLLLTGIFFVTGFIVNAQVSITVADDQLPQDTNVITGTLDNGLKYYIRKNSKPEQRVEFRLVVNAGSVLEDDDQQGIAHFNEHMAFNGTKHFDKNDLINFLEKSGVDFGADLNAYTSFDETVYMFQMPADRQGLLDSAFMVLEDWAHNVSYSDEEIDKERGVVHEEWRLGLGAEDRMMKKYIPIILKNSRYAERLPIGKMSVIDSCSPEALRRFYEDWYRPNLMAVIVVGDIDPVFAEEQIKDHFGKLKGPKKERPRTVYNIPDNDQPLVAIATDKEATYTIAALLYKKDKLPFETMNDYRLKLKIELYTSMLNARLFEILQDPDAPFLYGGVSYGSFLARSKDAYSMFVMVKENRINDAIALLIEENRRVKQFGFTENELQRQKAEMESNLQKAFQEKDKTDSRSFVGRYVSNFLEGKAFPGIENEVVLTNSFLPGITLDEINQLAFYMVKGSNLLVLITAPDKEGVRVPTEEEVLETIAGVEETVLTEYEDEAVAASLITNEPASGTVVKTSTDESFGTTTLYLNNGIKVTLKPTDFKNDEILMTSIGPGGTSVVSDEDYLSASFAGQIMSMSGVGDFDNIALKKYLTGKKVGVRPQIGVLSQGVSGNAVKKDLEDLFQLTYLYFTEPRKDTTAIKTFKSQMETQFRFMLENPQMVFYDTLYKLATQNDPRTIIIPTVEQINSIDLDKAWSFYKSSFSHAGDFEFVFVGNFTVEEITPLITKYLGSLPEGNGSSWKNVKPRFPSGITEAVVNKGTEPKSSVAILMDGEFDWSLTNRLHAQLLMKALNIRLRESMREDQGGVYGVGARQSLARYPQPEYSIFVTWGCGPENVDTLVSTVFNEMKYLVRNGPEDEKLEKAKETYLRDLETNVKENKYWLQKIKDAGWYKTKMLTTDELKTLVNSTTKQDLKKAAGVYFTPDHYLKVVLMPEEE